MKDSLENWINAVCLIQEVENKLDNSSTLKTKNLLCNLDLNPTSATPGNMTPASTYSYPGPLSARCSIKIKSLGFNWRRQSDMTCVNFRKKRFAMVCNRVLNPGDVDFGEGKAKRDNVVCITLKLILGRIVVFALSFLSFLDL